MKIVYLLNSIYEFRNGCFFIRIHIPAVELKQRGHKISYAILGSIEDEKKMIEENDILVFTRLYHTDPFKLLYRAKAMGKKIVYEIDDNIWTISPVNPVEPIFNQKAVQKTIEGLIEEADLITTTTDYLANILRKFNKNVWVCPNAINRDIYKEREKENKELRIGWSGSVTHFDDLLLIIDVIKDLQEKYNFKFILEGITGQPLFSEVTSWNFLRKKGWRSELNTFFDKALLFWEKLQKIKYTHIPFYIPFLYPQILRDLDIDIGLAPLLDSEFNSSKCLTEETLLMTDKGIKRIKNVSPEDKVYQKNFERVEMNIRYENQDIIEIETEDGYRLKGTPNHRISSNKKWIQLKDLKIGDSVDMSFLDFPALPYQEISMPFLLTKRINKNWKVGRMMPLIRIDEDWGRFLGYFLGDGSFHNNAIAISCSTDYPDIILDIERLAKEIGLSTATTNKRIKDKRFPEMNKDGKGRDIKISSRNLSILLESFGLREKNGKKIVKTPDVIFKSPKSVVREYIKALFETDGTISLKSGSCSFTSKDEQFIRDLQFLLLCFGIKSKVKGGYNKVYCRWYWRLSIKAKMLEKFQKEIGFISEKKNKKLLQIVNRRRSNNCDKCEMVEKVKKITFSRADVYDIEVPFENYYIANGFVSHNSCIKFYEYASLGTTTLASDVLPYNKEVNYLAKNTYKDWYKKLEKLIVDKEFRERILKEQQSFVFKNRDIKVVGEKWENAFKSLI